MSIDENIKVATTLTDLEIFQAVCGQSKAINVDDSDGDECVKERSSTNTEMRQAVDVLERGSFNSICMDTRYWIFEILRMVDGIVHIAFSHQRIIRPLAVRKNNGPRRNRVFVDFDPSLPFDP
ncbi:hypothetical protein AVEN_159376-1 [Araneus ventricosus]|uniref:Uncharacterized protein n=1 Tax=Araneus ventricosus TaxID=182803 RepID=A0A4Y2A0S5_ARAVE|nr:hypothetical protein AVEN_159376-1 [Araneus ventricosus]